MSKFSLFTVSIGLALALAGSVQADTNNAPAASQTNTLSGTVVLRVDSRDGSQALVSLPRPTSEANATALVQDGSQFQPLASNTAGRSELDQDGGTSSWYRYRPLAYGYPYGYTYANYGYYCPSYYYPTINPAAYYPSYYYYGSAYSPYYVYNYYPYTYYYYGFGW